MLTVNVDGATQSLHSTHARFAGLYQAITEEGRALTGAEAEEVDSALEDVAEYADEAAVAAAFAADPLLRHQHTVTGKLLQEESESVLSNKTGMQVTFLHSHAAPSGLRAATSVAVRTLQSVWLFECGEDTQRSLLGHPLVDWKRIDRIFLGSMSPEAVLGLPGMLCTISASRERGFELADIPVHVYGPPGLVSFVSTMLSISKTYLEMPVVLHEFTPRAVKEVKPVEVVRRSRLFGVQLPPNQLNADGFYDGQLTTMLSRHTKKRSTERVDSRAGTLPQGLPTPGDPELAGQIPVSDMVWTVRADHEWVIHAIPLKSKVPSIGYHIEESNRSGRLYPEVAEALGVADRDLFSNLKEGRNVELEDGRVVRPEQCVGPVRPGRRLAVVPPCIDSSGFAKVAGNADLLIHAMTPFEWFSEEEQHGGGQVSRSKGIAEHGIEQEQECDEGGLLQAVIETCASAGACAAEMNVMELVLWQPLLSLLDNPLAIRQTFALRALDASREAFGSDAVSLGGSFRAHQWERDEGGRVPPELPEHLMHLVPED